MNSALRSTIVASVLLLVATTTPARADTPAGQPSQVVKVVVDDMIHPISAEHIGRALDYAQQNHAQVVLLVLSTPGGLLDSTRDIVSRMLASPVPVIVYVAPTGARAASAGFFILEAADVAAMAPGTNTGAAHPVTLGGQQVDAIMKEKMENDSAAFLRSYVSKRGRNVEVAESAVRQSKSFTDQEALDQRLVDVIAANEQDLLKQLDGRTITRFDGSKITLHLGQTVIVDQPMSLRQRILSYIMDPNVAFALLGLGLLALYAEFNHPGAVVPGVVGVISILLAVFALNLLPTNYAALVLILAAFVLFALEAKFATHGILSVGGIAALTIGGLLLVDGPIPDMRVKIWTALGVSVPLGLITMLLMTLVVKARRKKTMLGPAGMVGEIGVARTPLAAEGKVMIQGEIWNAVSSADIAAGEPVRVRGVDGLVLKVEPARTTATRG
jgi:membrane-bound serine protease (ClpP class)